MEPRLKTCVCRCEIRASFMLCDAHSQINQDTLSSCAQIAKKSIYVNLLLVSSRLPLTDPQTLYVDLTGRFAAGKGHEREEKEQMQGKEKEIRTCSKRKNN